APLFYSIADFKLLCNYAGGLLHKETIRHVITGDPSDVLLTAKPGQLTLRVAARLLAELVRSFLKRTRTFEIWKKFLAPNCLFDRRCPRILHQTARFLQKTVF